MCVRKYYFDVCRSLHIHPVAVATPPERTRPHRTQHNHIHDPPMECGEYDFVVPQKISLLLCTTFFFAKERPLNTQCSISSASSLSSVFMVLPCEACAELLRARRSTTQTCFLVQQNRWPLLPGEETWMWPPNQKSPASSLKEGRRHSQR